MLLKLASLVPSLGKITSIYIQVGSISLSFDYLGMTHPAISCQSVGVSGLWNADSQHISFALIHDRVTITTCHKYILSTQLQPQA